MVSVGCSTIISTKKATTKSVNPENEVGNSINYKRLKAPVFSFFPASHKSGASAFVHCHLIPIYGLTGHMAQKALWRNAAVIRKVFRQAIISPASIASWLCSINLTAEQAILGNFRVRQRLGPNARRCRIRTWNIMTVLNNSLESTWSCSIWSWHRSTEVAPPLLCQHAVSVQGLGCYEEWNDHVAVWEKGYALQCLSDEDMISLWFSVGRWHDVLTLVVARLLSIRTAPWLEGCTPPKAEVGSNLF